MVKELHEPPPGPRRRPAKGGRPPEGSGGVSVNPNSARKIDPAMSDDSSHHATPVLTPEHYRHVPHMLLRKTRRAVIAPGPPGGPGDNDDEPDIRPPRPPATATAMAAAGGATAATRSAAARRTSEGSRSRPARPQGRTGAAGEKYQEKVDATRARATAEKSPAPAYDAACPPSHDKLRATSAPAVASTQVRYARLVIFRIYNLLAVLCRFACCIT